MSVGGGGRGAIDNMGNSTENLCGSIGYIAPGNVRSLQNYQKLKTVRRNIKPSLVKFKSRNGLPLI